MDALRAQGIDVSMLRPGSRWSILMRIALNAQLLSFSASYRQAGISRLIHATMQGLQEVDQDNDYTVFIGDRPIPSGYFRIHGGVQLPAACRRTTGRYASCGNRRFSPGR